MLITPRRSPHPSVTRILTRQAEKAQAEKEAKAAAFERLAAEKEEKQSEGRNKVPPPSYPEDF